MSIICPIIRNTPYPMPRARAARSAAGPGAARRSAPNAGPEKTFFPPETREPRGQAASGRAGGRQGGKSRILELCREKRSPGKLPFLPLPCGQGGEGRYLTILTALFQAGRRLTEMRRPSLICKKNPVIQRACQEGARHRFSGPKSRHSALPWGPVSAISPPAWAGHRVRRA